MPANSRWDLIQGFFRVKVPFKVNFPPSPTSPFHPSPRQQDETHKLTFTSKYLTTACKARYDHFLSQWKSCRNESTAVWVGVAERVYSLGWLEIENINSTALTISFYSLLKLCVLCKGKVKVKVTLVQALRLCTGRTAHRGSRGIALLFHDQRH